MSNKHKPEDTGGIKATISSRRAERLAKSDAQREEEARLWKIENADAIRSMNEWVERHGMPLAKYRPF